MVNFNACHGCIKCTVEGEWDHGGHHMSYPNITAPLRTDAQFRQMIDEDHHKEITPLVLLPNDMIKDFVVADSLHLFDLGTLERIKKLVFYSRVLLGNSLWSELSIEQVYYFSYKILLYI